MSICGDLCHFLIGRIYKTKNGDRKVKSWWTVSFQKRN